MLASRTCRDWRVVAAIVATAAVAPRVACTATSAAATAGRCIEADAPWAAADDDGVATADDPCVVAVTLVVPEIAWILEGAVLIGA